MGDYINLASDSIIWENIGGQIVTADMSSGVYCNIEAGSGVATWNLLLSGMSCTQVKDALKAHYNSVPSDFDGDIDGFIEILTARQIWKKSDTPQDIEEPISQSVSAHDESQDYKKPTIISYDDIDTLLQIDPIDDEIGEMMQDA